METNAIKLENGCIIHKEGQKVLPHDFNEENYKRIYPVPNDIWDKKQEFANASLKNSGIGQHGYGSISKKSDGVFIANYGNMNTKKENVEIHANTIVEAIFFTMWKDAKEWNFN